MNFRARNAMRVVPMPGPESRTEVTRFARSMRGAVDPNVVIAENVSALRAACLNSSVDVVRLRSGVEYRLVTDLTVDHPLRMEGAAGASLLPYSTAYTPVLVIASTGEDVELEGLLLEVPLLIQSRTECFRLRMDTAYGTDGTAAGKTISITGAGAAGSGLLACRGLDATPAIGVEIDATAAGSRVISCDFAVHATPYRIAALGGHHYGTLTGLVSDVNNGNVTVF